MSENIEEQIEKKNIPSWAKKLIIAVVVIAIVVGVGFGVYSLYGTQIKARVVYAVLPHSITANDYETDEEYTCIMELNKDFNSLNKEEKKQLGNAFSYKRINKDGTVIDLGINPNINFGENVEVSPFAQFVASAFVSGKLTKIITAVKVIAAILIIGFVFLVIYLWYRSWCKREDAKKETLYGHKNQNKHKKKK